MRSTPAGPGRKIGSPDVLSVEEAARVSLALHKELHAYADIFAPLMVAIRAEVNPQFRAVVSTPEGKAAVDREIRSELWQDAVGPNAAQRSLGYAKNGPPVTREHAANLERAFRAKTIAEKVVLIAPEIAKREYARPGGVDPDPNAPTLPRGDGYER